MIKLLLDRHRHRHRHTDTQSAVQWSGDEMFPQLASTAASLTRASSLMLKAGTDAHLYDDPHDADITRLLDSRFDAEKVEALKRLLALTAQGVDVSSFFPQVRIYIFLNLVGICIGYVYIYIRVCKEIID